MDKPLVPLTTMTERESKNGNRYFSGLLGNATLLLFRNPDGDSEYGESWNLLIQERKPKGNGQRRNRQSTAQPSGQAPQQNDRGGFVDDDVPFAG